MVRVVAIVLRASSSFDASLPVKTVREVHARTRKRSRAPTLPHHKINCQRARLINILEQESASSGTQTGYAEAVELRRSEAAPARSRQGVLAWQASKGAPPRVGAIEIEVEHATARDVKLDLCRESA